MAEEQETPDEEDKESVKQSSQVWLVMRCETLRQGRSVSGRERLKLRTTADALASLTTMTQASCRIFFCSPRRRQQAAHSAIAASSSLLQSIGVFLGSFGGFLFDSREGSIEAKPALNYAFVFGSSTGAPGGFEYVVAASPSRSSGGEGRILLGPSAVIPALQQVRRKGAAAASAAF
jgi:hypothetical protein